MLLGGPRGTFTLNGSLFSGALRGVHVPQPTNKSRKQSSGKMSLQEAERLRQLLRCTKPADLSENSVLQRIGNAIAKAINRPAKVSSSAKERR